MWGDSVPLRGSPEGIPESVYRLFDILGTYAIIAVLTFGAYTLGMIFMTAVAPAYSRLSTIPRVGSRTYADQTAFNLFAQIRPLEEDETGTASKRAMKALWAEVSNAELDENDVDLVKKVRKAVSTALGKGFEDAVVVLQTENHELWDIYDRSSAEAQFRFGIALPFGATVGLIGWQIFELSSYVSILFGVAGAAVMVFLSAQKLRESFAALRRGLEAADVKSRKQIALERLIGRINQ